MGQKYLKFVIFAKITFLQVYTRKTRFFLGINSNQAQIWRECSLGGSLGLVESFFEKKLFWAFLWRHFFRFFKKINVLAIKSRKIIFLKKALDKSETITQGTFTPNFSFIGLCIFCWRQHFFQKNHTECEQNFFFL